MSLFFVVQRLLRSIVATVFYKRQLAADTMPIPPFAYVANRPCSADIRILRAHCHRLLNILSPWQVSISIFLRQFLQQFWP
jgi:hypothetical protein